MKQKPPLCVIQTNWFFLVNQVTLYWSLYEACLYEGGKLVWWPPEVIVLESFAPSQTSLLMVLLLCCLSLLCIIQRHLEIIKCTKLILFITLSFGEWTTGETEKEKRENMATAEKESELNIPVIMFDLLTAPHARTAQTLSSCTARSRHSCSSVLLWLTVSLEKILSDCFRMHQFHSFLQTEENTVPFLLRSKTNLIFHLSNKSASWSTHKFYLGFWSRLYPLGLNGFSAFWLREWLAL